MSQTLIQTKIQSPKDTVKGERTCRGLEKVFVVNMSDKGLPR